mmetsp:Transcript_3506/g.7217  ORF Transcript_3506/g.7217 Transcript_3506/m.7217 type:complete len:282 (+) Transcript_3506:70-915(+)
MAPAAAGSAECTTPLTMLSSFFICAFIRSTSASAFMRAMMSFTFCLSLGFSARFLGSPCASAHLRSFCCFPPPLLVVVAAAFLAASFCTAAFLAWSCPLNHLASSAGLTLALADSLRSFSSCFDIDSEACRSWCLVCNFFISFTPSLIAFASLPFMSLASCSFLAACLGCCLLLLSCAFIQSVSFFGSAAALDVSSSTCLSCLDACSCLPSSVFFTALTSSFPASLIAFWLSFASFTASRLRALSFFPAWAGSWRMWVMLLALIESVWESRSFLIASILSW